MNSKKTINLYIELCNSWLYTPRLASINKILVKELEERGYEVKVNLRKIEGLNGEYYIYTDIKGKKLIVFSNNKELHQKEQAIIGQYIDYSNVDYVINLIIS